MKRPQFNLRTKLCIVLFLGLALGWLVDHISLSRKLARVEDVLGDAMFLNSVQIEDKDYSFGEIVNEFARKRTGKPNWNWKTHAGSVAVPSVEPEFEEDIPTDDLK